MPRSLTAWRVGAHDRPLHGQGMGHVRGILEPNSRVEARGSPEQMKTEGKTPEWCPPAAS